MIPGFYGVHAFILVLFVLLNIHFGSFFLSGASAKGLCFAAAPWLYQVGGFVQRIFPACWTCWGGYPCSV